MLIKASENVKKNAVLNIIDWMDSIIISLFIVIMFFTFLFSIVGVIGPSMENTLKEGDKLVISSFMYTPKYGDIVIVSRNHDNLATDDKNNFSDEPIVKRVIAVAGQKIVIKDGKVFVDGKEIQEDYITTPTENRDFPEEGRVVPEGYVFVMGDNRYVSHDSRSSDIGMVNVKYIMGKVLFRFFPFSKFSLL